MSIKRGNAQWILYMHDRGIISFTGGGVRWMWWVLRTVYFNRVYEGATQWHFVLCERSDGIKAFLLFLSSIILVYFIRI